MNRLAELVAGASKTRGRNDDDFVDRLSSRYTVVFLVVFAVLVSMNQYVRNPITCWAPVHFTGAHTKFATQYCWIKNTYYVPWDEEVPTKEVVDRERRMVPYYQWISFVLLLQAVLFYAPSLVWHGLNSKAGVDADNVLAAAHSLSRTDKAEAQEKTLQILARHIDRFLSSRQRQDAGCGRGFVCLLSTLLCRACGRRIGCYLLILFLISKVLYIANIIGQLFILNKVLAMKYNTFGFDMVSNLAGAKDWTEEYSYVAFPRVTYCDFDIRGQDLGNTQRYTVQCVLPINMYNEKIFLFLWFWMVLVCAVSVLSFLVWVVRAFHKGDRVKFVKNHLRLGRRVFGNVDGSGEELVRKFTFDYLGQDGTFIMRLIAHNTDNVTTTEIICVVWDAWKEKNVATGEKMKLYPHEAIELISPEGKGV